MAFIQLGKILRFGKVDTTIRYDTTRFDNFNFTIALLLKTNLIIEETSKLWKCINQSFTNNVGFPFFTMMDTFHIARPTFRQISPDKLGPAV
jgi:hypothetical protein